MKVVEFPQAEKQDDRKTALEFLDETRKIAEENGVTDLVVVMMSEDRSLGVSVFADYVEAHGMLSLALKEF